MIRKIAYGVYTILGMSKQWLLTVAVNRDAEISSPENAYSLKNTVFLKGFRYMQEELIRRKFTDNRSL